MFELNVLSAIALTKAVLPAMLERRAGAFCVVGSMATKCPGPGQAAYAATKAALARVFHSLRGEVADRGLTVTVAHPGPIATGLDGQTRVVFGATLAKSTTKTVDAEKPTSEGAAAKEEEEGLGGKRTTARRTRRKSLRGSARSGWTGVVARRVAAGRRTGWTRSSSRRSRSCCSGTSCSSFPPSRTESSTRWGRSARGRRGRGRACTSSRVDFDFDFDPRGRPTTDGRGWDESLRSRACVLLGARTF